MISEIDGLINDLIIFEDKYYMQLSKTESINNIVKSGRYLTKAKQNLKKTICKLVYTDNQIIQ